METTSWYVASINLKSVVGQQYRKEMMIKIGAVQTTASLYWVVTEFRLYCYNLLARHFSENNSHQGADSDNQHHAVSIE